MGQKRRFGPRRPTVQFALHCRHPAGQPRTAAANGKADIGTSQVSEIIASPYADLAGALPSDIQNYAVLTAIIPKSATAPDAAKVFIEFLTSSRAGSIYKSNGMEPG
jgi:molybdate transport system substrate-binding protein